MFHGKVSPEIAAGLKVLRKRIRDAQIPSSKLDESLNIATWNIREFGRKRRSQPAIHYIAEILGQFDVVSLVELRDDLSDLGRVMEILGPYWRVVYSDALKDDGGNRERIAFLYDKRAAVFTGFAAAANPPRTRTGTGEYLPTFNWWRQPYMASFSAGNFDFLLLAAHIQWGTSAGRVKELASLAEWIDLKRNERTKEDKDLIVLGDYNLETAAQIRALTSRGLALPSAFKGKAIGTNLARDKSYDQILHYPVYPETFSNRAGVLDFFTGGIAAMFPGMERDAFTYQMSDHLPLWMQLRTDIEGFELDQILREARKKNA
ncbi:MAG: endonuclease/exonuclease/phosphatase family protein [Burkholderiales bacterium]|nr:endonuclease/exonuclease/phosphatase family protein [Burkholderiales bacterium]